MPFGISDFLSRLLKDCELFEQRTALGNLLQNAGAAAVKLRSPSVLWVIRSLRYAGASPWIAL